MRYAALLLALAVPVVAGAQDAQRYTPGDVWRNAEDAKFKEMWFGKHLASMQASHLVTEAAAKGYSERYRMLVLPTFHRPYAVMVDRRRDGRATVRLVVTDGRGGYGEGKVVKDDVRPLASADWGRIAQAMGSARLSDRRTQSDFGGEFTSDVPSPTGDMTFCIDGTQIVFERRTPAGYAIVSRHECSLDAPIRTLVEATLALTGQTFDRREGYILRDPAKR